MSNNRIETLTGTTGMDQTYTTVTGTSSEDGLKRALDTSDAVAQATAASILAAFLPGGSVNADSNELMSVLNLICTNLQEIKTHLSIITGEKL